jgi:hypothetical protein
MPSRSATSSWPMKSVTGSAGSAGRCTAGSRGAFETRAVEAGAHLLEFWTDHEAEEALLTGFGWRRAMRRENYIGRRTWFLLEKTIQPAG